MKKVIGIGLVLVLLLVGQADQWEHRVSDSLGQYWIAFNCSIANESETIRTDYIMPRSLGPGYLARSLVVINTSWCLQRGSLCFYDQSLPHLAVGIVTISILDRDRAKEADIKFVAEKMKDDINRLGWGTSEEYNVTGISYCTLDGRPCAVLSVIARNNILDSENEIAFFVAWLGERDLLSGVFCRSELVQEMLNTIRVDKL
jgi:hypothetical protein